MKPIHRPALPPRQHKELDHLDRTTKDPRRRTRMQMVFLAAEQRLKGPQLAVIVREREATVLRWLKRYLAEGLNGWQDAPRPGRPSEVTAAYQAAVLAAVCRRPRRLPLPFSWWTLPRLADALAECTGLRVSEETVRRALKQAGMVRSCPQPKSSSPDPEYPGKQRRWKRPARI